MFSNTMGLKSSKTTDTDRSENPSYPKFSFANLGANRAVMITVYTALGILGTMETIFWTKALWRYFAPPTDVPDATTQSDQ